MSKACATRRSLTKYWPNQVAEPKNHPYSWPRPLLCIMPAWYNEKRRKGGVHKGNYILDTHTTLWCIIEIERGCGHEKQKTIAYA